MTGVAAALVLLLTAAEPAATCHSDTAVLTVVLDGVEVDVGDRFVLRRLWRGPEGEETSPRAVVAGGVIETDAGPVSFQLSLGERWLLRRGEEQLELPAPRAMRQPNQVSILGVGPAHVWLAAPGGLARLSVADATLETARIGRRKEMPLALEIGERALVVSGAELLDCASPTTCTRVAQLPGTVTRVVSGPGGWLLAVEGNGAGLYRAPASLPAEAGPLIEGEVLALCGTEEGEAWAVLTRDEETRVVAASTDTPAVRPFATAEIFTRGITAVDDAELTAHVLRAARAHQWPELEVMALAVMRDEREAMRRCAAEALGGVLGARATAALWLLGRDRNTEVRMEAVHASAERCQDDPGVTCRDALSAFIADADREVAWTARDLLLEFEPRAALDSAPAVYKIDAIAMLVSRLQRNGDLEAERALEMLAADPEPSVRAAARMALAGAQR